MRQGFTGRPGVEGAMDGRWDHGNPGAGDQTADARLEAGNLTIAAARSFGEKHENRGVAGIIGRVGKPGPEGSEGFRAAAGAPDRQGVENEGRGRGAGVRLEKVVARGQRGNRRSKAGGQRRAQKQGVEVGAVVGDDNEGPSCREVMPAADAEMVIEIDVAADQRPDQRLDQPAGGAALALEAEIPFGEGQAEVGGGVVVPGIHASEQAIRK